ncbi:hypothetical protein SELMODRAFT_416419 [Selaginella moellendorffii]|uniref:Uncharacterized protein n=1 Tax=Selaginella moellendorffii TaxID=88036 RepID=D8RZ81_SELML|nr:hypothetical protein SELMODRAFT_416419 [Selaginella moellendorffii]
MHLSLEFEDLVMRRETMRLCSERLAGGEGEEEANREELSMLALVLDTLRRSLLTCKASEEEVASMDIGWPTNVRHVTTVTFDKFNGFLGLPVEFEIEIPQRVPSASASVFGVSPESMQCSYDLGITTFNVKKASPPNFSLPSLIPTRASPPDRGPLLKKKPSVQPLSVGFANPKWFLTFYRKASKAVRMGQEYVVDFTFGESMVHDPVTERDYFPLIMSPKDFGDGFTMTGGRFYPADEEGVHCTAVILDDAEDAERNQYMFSNVQKVSKDGEVLESTDWRSNQIGVKPGGVGRRPRAQSMQGSRMLLHEALKCTDSPSSHCFIHSITYPIMH